MLASDLLLAMLLEAMKARDVARIIRSERTLLELLVEEKTGAEQNKRFAQDFKTLADVLIQQMVAHDLAAQVSELMFSFDKQQHVQGQFFLVNPFLRR
jgi:inositol polyphosphate 1-phosphatase